MFNNKRYITQEINNKLSPKLKNKLWEMIEKARKKTQLDYLQVFNLEAYSVTIDKGHKYKVWIQKITHFQEEPSFKQLDFLSLDVPINEKIYVIDNKEYSTMLLSREY
ncbi:MAG: DUF960 family protein [Halanaerobiales bacterium]